MPGGVLLAVVFLDTGLEVGAKGIEWEVEVGMSMMGVQAAGRGRIVVHTYTLCCPRFPPPTTQATDPSRLNATQL
jgi:hypothetical protein